MSDGICAARRWQVRCQKWINIVVRRCSYTLSTEAVLPSIHYARSVISCSGAISRRHHGTLFIEIWNPEEYFFEKSSGQNPPCGSHRRAPLGTRNAQALTTSLLVLRHYEHLFLFPILILHVMSSLFCIYLLDIYHFT